MSKETLTRLGLYKKKHKLTDTALAKELGIYRIYLNRWRKSGNIIGAYERIIDDFLNKEKENGKL